MYDSAIGMTESTSSAVSIFDSTNKQHSNSNQNLILQTVKEKSEKKTKQTLSGNASIASGITLEWF